MSLGDYGRKMHAAAERAVDAVGLALLQQTQDNLATPGRGRIRGTGRTRVGKGSFRRVKNGDGVRVLKRVTRGVAKVNIDNTNRASAPGDPPAPDTGALRSSITYERAGLRAQVGTNLAYAKPLEYGTPRIAPRPFLRPAVAAIRGRMASALADSLKKP